MIALADQPLINAQDITDADQRIQEARRRTRWWCRVWMRAHPGNPVILEAALREQWLAGDMNASCRHWRERHPERVRWFDTDNRRYAIDIDTPQDLERFTERTGHALRWPAHLVAA